MKIKILLAALLTGALFWSCSDDDVTVSQSPSEKKLKTIATTHASYHEIKYFENNRLINRKYFNNEVLFLEDTYSYNSAGLLIRHVENDFENSEVIEKDISYDNNGRISSVVYKKITNGQLNFNETRTFDYSTSGKIVETGVVAGQNTWSKNYHLDNNGRVYKTSHDTYPGTEKTEFQEDNIIVYKDIYYAPGSSTPFTYMTTFTYDNTTSALGQYINIENNRFGPITANTALYNKTISFSQVGYLTKKVYQGIDVTTTDYTYEYDDDGYPILIKIFTNGILDKQSQIIYE